MRALVRCQSRLGPTLILCRRAAHRTCGGEHAITRSARCASRMATQYQAPRCERPPNFADAARAAGRPRIGGTSSYGVGHRPPAGGHQAARQAMPKSSSNTSPDGEAHLQASQTATTDQGRLSSRLNVLSRSLPPPRRAGHPRTRSSPTDADVAPLSHQPARLRDTRQRGIGLQDDERLWPRFFHRPSAHRAMASSVY